MSDASREASTDDYARLFDEAQFPAWKPGDFTLPSAVEAITFGRSTRVLLGTALEVLGWDKHRLLDSADRLCLEFSGGTASTLDGIIDGFRTRASTLRAYQEVMVAAESRLMCAYAKIVAEDGELQD